MNVATLGLNGDGCRLCARYRLHPQVAILDIPDERGGEYFIAQNLGGDLGWQFITEGSGFGHHFPYGVDVQRDVH